MSHCVVELEPEIEESLTQLHNCLQLLLPSPQDFDIIDAPEPSHSHRYRHRNSPRHMVRGDGNARLDSDDVAHTDDKMGKDGADVEKDGTNIEKDGVGMEKDGTNMEKDGTDAEKDGTNMEKDGIDAEKDGTNIEKDGIDVEKDGTNVEKDGTNMEKDGTNMEKDGADVEKDGSDGMQDEAEAGDFVRRHGLGSLSYTIEVCVNDVQLTETEDNVDLLDTLQDTMRLVTGKFLPSTRHWLEVGLCVCMYVCM